MTPAELREKVARAINGTETEYTLTLTRLIDGVSTYRLRYDVGDTLELSGTEDAYAHINSKRDEARADTAIAIVLEEAAKMQPSTAANPNEDAYQRGRFDGIMEYAAAIRALKGGA